MVGEKMSGIQRIKNFFKKGVKRIDMNLNGRELGKITDHPKIDMNMRESLKIFVIMRIISRKLNI